MIASGCALCMSSGQGWGLGVGVEFKCGLCKNGLTFSLMIARPFTLVVEQEGDCTFTKPGQNSCLSLAQRFCLLGKLWPISRLSRPSIGQSHPHTWPQMPPIRRGPHHCEQSKVSPPATASGAWSLPQYFREMATGNFGARGHQRVPDRQIGRFVT